MMQMKLLTSVLILVIFSACNSSLEETHSEMTHIPLNKALKLYSDKALGFTEEDGDFVFRLFAPRAIQVRIAFFETHDGPAFSEEKMTRDADGVWEFRSSRDLWNRYYGYYVKGPAGKGEIFDETVLVADPYSFAVATENSYLHPGRSIIYRDSYDWEGDRWITPDDPRDLVIYEAHLRDLTAHGSSGVEQSGSYLGLTEEGRRGGLKYLKTLGINAVEFLPLQDFGNMEIPYNVETEGLTNTWNPYERNHWGYMTSYFFAPESYYASQGSMNPGEYNGIQGQQVTEFKDMVKALHREGIAVIMDVVYNHVSQYDQNCFKLIDKKYYFRVDEAWDFLKVSGCGNDFRTESPMARRLIVDSVIHWMKEYHVDGFRFDLAAMIDEETLQLILSEARKVNPNVIIIAEPWGGGYMPERFSELGWASWNDKFRNAVKGQNPRDRQGYILGRWDNGTDRESFPTFFMGSLASDALTYQNSSHAVNYLASHDDHTLGDFIRLAIGKNRSDELITDIDRHALLNSEEMAIHRLGAFILATSQGIPMIHSGQEFGRSKVIADSEYPDSHVGRIDHNSYEKDNETNYINYDHAWSNRPLLHYYSQLLALRREMPELRAADRDHLDAVYSENVEMGIGYRVKAHGELRDCYILMNSSRDSTALFMLDEGRWDIYADEASASVQPLRKGIVGQVTLPPRGALLLVRH